MAYLPKGTQLTAVHDNLFKYCDLPHFTLETVIVYSTLYKSWQKERGYEYVFGTTSFYTKKLRMSEYAFNKHIQTLLEYGLIEKYVQGEGEASSIFILAEPKEIPPKPKKRKLTLEDIMKK